MSKPTNFFSYTEKSSTSTNTINLDSPTHLTLIPAPLTTPDLLSLFFHNTNTTIQKSVTSVDIDQSQRRYFADTLICYECGDVGHVSCRCPNLKLDVCIMCGFMGHDRNECPMTVCNRCYMLGHCAKECTGKRAAESYMLCKVCAYGEHTIGDCPRKWRVYVVMGDVREDRLVKCCSNCYSGNHYVDDCSRGGPRTRFSIFNSRFKSMVRLIKK